MYQAKSGVKNFSPLLRLGHPPPPPRPRLDQPTQKSETWDPPLPPRPRLDQPIRKSETWDPPPKC